MCTHFEKQRQREEVKNAKPKQKSDHSTAGFVKHFETAQLVSHHGRAGLSKRR